jgi:integrase
MRLTDISVKNAKPRPNAAGQRIRTEYPDDGCRGLWLICQPSGAKSWGVRYRRLSDRRPRKVTLQGFCSLRAARQEARRILERVQEGGDPAAERKVARAAEQRGSDAVEHVFLDFLQRHTRSRRGAPLRETTVNERARQLGFKLGADGWQLTGSGAAARWKGRTIQSIARRDILDLIDDIAQRAPVSANRNLATLGCVFNWVHWRDPDRLLKIPTAGLVQPSPEVTRSRVLTDAEIAAAWRFCEQQGFPYGRLAQLLVLTGCRLSEVRLARWSEFDLPRQWSIPGGRTKNGCDMVVPLGDAAVNIIQSLPRIGTSDFLFSLSGKGPVSDSGGLTQFNSRLRSAMREELGEVPHFVNHDWRRTFVSGLQRLGFSIEVCEACVNHRSGTLRGVAGIYARHSYADEKRAAFSAWGRHVEAIVSGQLQGSVLQFPVRS